MRASHEYRQSSSKARLGHKAWNEGLKGFLAGDKHYNWNKGTSLNYSSLHIWVKRRLGKPSLCTNCLSKTNLHWANKSGLYKRDLADWVQLCRLCHKKYDEGRNSMKKYYNGHKRIA